LSSRRALPIALDELVEQAVAVLCGDLLAQDPDGELDRELRRLLAQASRARAQLVLDGGRGVGADPLGRPRARRRAGSRARPRRAPARRSGSRASSRSRSTSRRCHCA
jgi:hypothetical protein